MPLKSIALAFVFFLMSAGIAGAQIITSPSGTVAVTAADEFATRVMQDPWDMNQRTDLGWFTYGVDQPTHNLSSMQFSGGVFSATPTSGDPNFWLLDPPTYGRVRYGKDGQTYPIDASKYRRVMIRMSLATGANADGQVLWNVTNGQAGFGAATFQVPGPSGTVSQGWRIYVVDLAGATYSGLVDSLRIDPTTTAASGQVQVDWARLVDPNQSMRTISWSGAGTFDIYLSDTPGCGGNVARIGLSQSSGSFQFYVAGLPAGDWYVGMAASSVNATAPTACSSGFFRVSGVPTIAFTSPSEEGSSDDFATAQLGNAWDMQSLNDIDHFRKITGLGITSIQAQTTAGASLGTINVLSGTSMAGDGTTGQATCGGVTFNVGDPHVYPLWYHPGAESPMGGRGLNTRIDTSRYRIVTFEQAIPRDRDLCRGSVARVVWKVAGQTTENVTSDILLHHGPSTMVPVNGSSGQMFEKITLDLADRTTVPIDPGSPGQTGWVNGSDSNPGLDNFRVDFHEFGDPTAFFLRRVKLAALERPDTSYQIALAIANPPAGTTVSFFDDTNGIGFDGAPINGCTSLTATANTTCTWNTTSLVQNSLHYIYAVVSNGGTVINQAYAKWPIQAFHPGQVPPTLTVDRTTLRFNAVSGTSARTPAQILTLGQTGGTGSLPWTASSNATWLTLSPSSGAGAAGLVVSLTASDPALQNPGTYNGTISVAGSGSNTVTINVIFQVVPPGATVGPIGQVDTPLQNASGVQGAIGVTGWSLDDIGVNFVQIFRNCLSIDVAGACQSINGVSAVFVGDANFVPGARSDLEAGFSNYPQNHRGGWGYLMLTNMLPNVTGGLGFGGEGPLTLYAFATDMEGNRRLLGRVWTGPESTQPTFITMSNSTIAKPFGAIDTPGQGHTVSGMLANFGWALTPDSNTFPDGSDILVPTNGSTMHVVIDGASVGTVAYNQCRGTVGNPVPAGQYCNDDVSNIFGNPTPQPSLQTRTSNPTRHRNLDAGRAPIGAFDINTASMTNGRHSLAWGVTDTAGRPEGIGSRDFIVLNGSRPALRAMIEDAPAAVVGSVADLADRPIGGGEVLGRTGFNFNKGLERVDADAAGERQLTIPELGRLELWLGESYTTGFLKANGNLRPLPPGSAFDAASGRFTWSPLVGYIGPYELVFAGSDYQLPVTVTIAPKTPPAAGLMRGHIDGPASWTPVSGAFTVAGWAMDLGAWQGSGVGAVHVWARRLDMPAALPIFVGAAEMGVERPDVAAAFGSGGARSGWHVWTSGLEAGAYELTAYFWSNRTERFEDARTVSITVR